MASRKKPPAKPALDLSKVEERIASIIKGAPAQDLEFPLVKYQDNPVGFAKDILGIELWAKQIEILEAFKSHRRISVKSGHRCGKSTTAVVAALWFYSCFPEARVVFTASTANQIRNVLWRELKRILGKALVKIPGDLKELPSSGFTSEDLREIKGFTARDAEAMQGIAGKHILFVIDEASGVDDRIYEALEGNRAAGAYLLMISNPTRTQGTFYLSHTKRREFYKTFTISSEEVPNVKEGREIIPGLASKEWVEEKRREWGEDSPLYQVRVKGNFPSGDSNTIVSVSLIEEATRLWSTIREPGLDFMRSPLYKGTLELGVDTARFGDDESVVIIVRGKNMLGMEAMTHSKSSTKTCTEEVISAIFKLIREHSTPRDPIPIVKVDGTGGYGSGVIDALRKRGSEVRVIEYNASQRAYDAKEYTCLRDELWFQAAQWLREGGTLIDDEKLHGDLGCPLYTFDEKGRRKAESKKDIKKRLGRSPDRADAFCLAVYSESRPEVDDSDEYPEDDFETMTSEISPYSAEISPYG